MPKQFHAFLTNCLFIGEEWQSLADGTRVRNVLEISVAGYKFTLHGAIDLLESQKWRELNGKSLVTAMVLIEATRDISRGAAECLVHTLCDLMSFALSSEVKPEWGPDDWDMQSFPSGRPFAVNTRFSAFETPFGSELRDFVTQTWRAYRVNRAKRKLNITAGYYGRSFRDGDSIQLSLAIAFVLLEHLKTTWALANGYPFVKPSFRYPPGHPRAGKPCPFACLVTGMLASQQMTVAPQSEPPSVDCGSPQ